MTDAIAKKLNLGERASVDFTLERGEHQRAG